MKPMVVIVSQDVEFWLVFDHILRASGFSTGLAHKTDDVCAAIEKMPPTAIVLDCQPTSDFASMIGRFKGDDATSQIQIVAVLAADAQARHIDLLAAGVDEVFQRPFPPAKLINQLGQGQPAKPSKPASLRRVLRFRDVELNLETHRVHAAGKEIQLPPIEYKLLQHFMLSPGKVFAREELIEAAWPPNTVADERSVDVHIGRLRKMLKTTVGHGMIRTVRRAGYALAEQGAG